MKGAKPSRIITLLTLLLVTFIALAPLTVLPELFGFLSGDSDRPAMISISTDDGFASVYRIAFPVFRERGIPATAFVIASEIGLQGHFNVSQLMEMQQCGWEIGSHSLHHVNLTELSETELRNEVIGSKQLLTSYGFNVSSFAYPFSEANESVVRTVREVYTAARLTYGFGDYVGYDPILVKRNSFTIKALSLDCDFETVRGHIDTAIESHEWVNFYFHGVLRNAKIGDNLTWTLADLADHIRNKMDAGLLKATTFIDAFDAYMKMVKSTPVWPSQIPESFDELIADLRLINTCRLREMIID